MGYSGTMPEWMSPTGTSGNGMTSPCGWCGGYHLPGRDSVMVVTMDGDRFCYQYAECRDPTKRPGESNNV